MPRSDGSRSPYLRQEGRLADVIAAIQATGASESYKLRFAQWAKRICGDEGQADHWRRVFEEHPEFFRIDPKKERASLVLRRQRRKSLDPETGKILTKAQAEALDDTAKSRLSTPPLSPGETEALINAAISLHSRAAELERDRRSLVTALLGFLGALLGGTIAAIAAALLATN